MKRSLSSLVPLALGLSLLTACSSGGEGGGVMADKEAPPTVTTSPTTKAPEAPPATFALKKRKVQGADLQLTPLSFQTDGTFQDLTLQGKGSERARLKRVSPQEWAFTGYLQEGEAYTAVARVKNATGQETRKTVKFSTVQAATHMSPTIYPVDDQKVGVGMPVTITFDAPVKEKAHVEKLLKVTTVPKTEGSWGWMENDTHVVWRPKTFWKPGTKVSVEAPLEDVAFGNRAYGVRKVTTKFSVGRDLRVKVSDASKEATVVQGGKVVKTFPVSLGKPGHLTSSGTHIIYAKANPERMKGEDYDQVVNYAMRYTVMGEYIHSAPWSVGAQGNTNVSHGCVNAPPAAAKWLYDRVLMGDVVTITGTARKAQEWNGMGGIWNLSWGEWQERSALPAKK